MTPSSKFSLVTLLLFFALASCESLDNHITTSEPVVNEPSVKAFPNVDQELWLYFQRFEEEALLRGLEVDLIVDNITGTIAEIEEDRVAGQCSFQNNRPRHVMIDKEFWDNASDNFREFVVFHELGHCSLFRDHREDVLATGTCASIMRSGSGTCRDNYRIATRIFYLDELYDPSFFGDIFQ